MMSQLNPSLLSVSVADDPEFDDLALSQFPFVHVPERVHRPSVQDDDPYSLEVDLGDLEVSFTNLTEQYAPVVQRFSAAPGGARRAGDCRLAESRLRGTGQQGFRGG
jgi:hypothetical protein